METKNNNEILNDNELDSLINEAIDLDLFDDEFMADSQYDFDQIDTLELSGSTGSFFLVASY